MGKVITRPLRWEGFYRPGVVPWNNNGSMPDCQNVEPLPTVSGFKAVNGATRLTVDIVTGEYASSEVGIITFPASYYGVNAGTGLATVVSTAGGAEAIVAHALHKSETGTSVGSVTNAQALRYVRANQWGKWVSLHGNSYYFDGENPVWCWDGERVRRAGIRPPRIRPVIFSAIDAGNTIDAMDSGWLANASLATGAHNTADFKEGTGSYKIAYAATGTGVLAYKGAAESLTAFTFDASDDRLRFYIKCDKFIPSGCLKWTFTDSASATYDVSINQDIYAGAWHLVELDWTHGAVAVTGAARLVELRTTSDYPLAPATIWIDGLLRIQLTAGGVVTGNIQICYTFYDPVRDRESAPSPESAYFSCPSAGCLLIFGISDDHTPEDTTNVTKVRIYLKNSALDAFNYYRVAELAYAPIAPGYNAPTNATFLLAEKLGQGLAEPPSPGSSAVIVGDRILSCSQMTDYSTGTVTATLGSDVITGSGTSFQRFMEGMSIRMGTDAYVYTIIRVVSTTSLRITRTFTAFGLSASLDGSGYEGSTGAGKSYVIAAHNDRVSYSGKFLRDPASNVIETDSESWPADNFFLVRPNDGDSVVGLGLAGTYPIVFKRGSTFLVAPNFGTADNDPAGDPFNDPELISDVIGCRAPRSVAQDAAGRCIWLASNNAIVRYSLGGGIETIVPSDIMGEALNASGGFLQCAVEADLNNAFGHYDAVRNRYYLFVLNINLSGGTTEANNVLVVDFTNNVLFVIDPTNGLIPYSATTIIDDSGRQRVYLGDDVGFLWKWNDNTAGNWGVGAATYVYTLMGGSATTAALTTTIQPNAAAGNDATLSSNNADTNFPDDTSVIVGEFLAGNDLRMICKFDISNIPRSAVNTATLNLNVDSNTRSGDYWVQRTTTTSWTESGVTWNNQPETTTTNRATLSVSGTGAVSATVTEMLKDAISNGDTVFSFILSAQVETTSGALASFDSSDHATAGNRPSLVISSTSSTFSTTGQGLASLYATLIRRNNTSAPVTRRITSNTSTVLTFPSSSFSPSPAAGDTIIVGAIESYVDCMEHYAPSGLNAPAIRIDAKSESGNEFDMQVFTGTAGGRFTDPVGATEGTNKFTTYLAHANMTDPTHFIPLNGGVHTRAMRYRLHWFNRGYKFDVYNLEAPEIVEGGVSK